MSDLLPLFEAKDAPEPPNASKPTITSSQRDALRKLFSELGGGGTAREQFALVEEISGQRISSVGELLASSARVLIYQLPARIQSKNGVATGNDWADREDDTWIDKL